MARITIEDCLERVGNRFHLVLLATKRARNIATKGVEPMIEREGDKPTVLALREIAECGLTEEEVSMLKSANAQEGDSGSAVA